MMTDPIADMLTRIRNAAAARIPTVSLPYSRVKFAIAKIFEREGYLAEVSAEDEHVLKINMRYHNGAPAIENVKRVSKPGRRVYAKKEELPTVLSGNGIAVISTSQGIMTNVEAKARKLGGEVICEVY